MLPERPFYLIRHGQSTANEQRITAGGRFDAPLTQMGENQAKTLSPFLRGLTPMPAQIYHSPMIRAHDTARYLNQSLNLPMTAMDDLREHDMGIWDGMPWEDILPLLEDGYSPPGGETEQQFAQRIQSVITDILKREEQEGRTAPPLLVAHGGLFHAIGFLYEYGMAEVRNCHLHYFEPYPSLKTFPWRVWHFDPQEDGVTLKRELAPFNLSHALERLVQ